MPNFRLFSFSLTPFSQLLTLSLPHNRLENRKFVLYGGCLIISTRVVQTEKHFLERFLNTGS